MNSHKVTEVVFFIHEHAYAFRNQIFYLQFWHIRRNTAYQLKN
jgi:hypothetical protein